MKRMHEPTRNGVAVALVDEGQNNARHKGVEPRVGPKIERAVEERVPPRRIAEVNDEARGKGAGPEDAEEHEACAIAPEPMQHEKQERHRQVELLFERERP